MILAPASSAAQVWAVDHESVQVTWGWFPPGHLIVDGIGPTRTIEHLGGPGGLVLDGARPETTYWITIKSDAARGTHRLSVTTPKAPPGRLLCRVATVSDIHLGARHWGFLKTMGEVSPASGHRTPDAEHEAKPFGAKSSPGTTLPPTAAGRTTALVAPARPPRPGRPPGPYTLPHPWRCATAAVDEAKAWGADLLVLKGDLLEHENAQCIEPLGPFVDSFPDLPMMAIPGNHDVDGGGTRLPSVVGRRRLPIVRHVAHLDLPGARVIVADTTIPGRGMGTVDRVADDIVERAARAGRPVLLFLHHQLQARRVNHYWPVGVPAPGSTRLLDRLDELDVPVVVSSGHTHRNRVRHHRSVLVTEVASTKDWPGVWAGYSVFEGGVTQTVRRISRHDVIVWTEYSRNAVAGLWAHWSPGRIEDRCVSRIWAD